MGRARVGAPRGAKHATLGPSASAPVLPVMRVDDPAASPEPTGGTSSQEQRDLEQIGHIANFAADPALMAALDLDERAVVARAREVTLQSQQQSPVQKSPGTDHGSPASTRIPILKSSDSFKHSTIAAISASLDAGLKHILPPLLFTNILTLLALEFSQAPHRMCEKELALRNM